MRIALISDIHGNAVALDAVIDDIAQRAVDQIVCLGDVATLGPQPRAVIARLQDLGCVGIVGNHDRNLFDSGFLEQSHAMYSARVLAATVWCQQQLEPTDLAYLCTYLPRMRFDLGGGMSLLCFHGSPASCREVIVATTPEAELEAHFSPYSATVLAGGHTHVPMLRRYHSSVLLNPGSLGQPFEHFPTLGERPCILPWAEYAIVSQVKGVLDIDLRRVPVDGVAVRQAVLASDLPLQDVLLSPVIGHGE